MIIPINPEVSPVGQKYRPVPIPLQKEIKQEINKLLEAGIIEKIDEPSRWISPIVPIIRSDSSLRICVDIRRTNEAIIKKSYPFLTIEDVRYKIRKSNFFTKLDIRKAFHQTELN